MRLCTSNDRFLISFKFVLSKYSLNGIIGLRHHRESLKMEKRVILAFTVCSLAVYAFATTLDENSEENVLRNVLLELANLKISNRLLEKRTIALENEWKMIEIPINDLEKSNKANIEIKNELTNLNYNCEKRVDNLSKLVRKQGQSQRHSMNEMKMCDENYISMLSVAERKLNGFENRLSAAGMLQADDKPVGKMNSNTIYETIISSVQMKDSDKLPSTYKRSPSTESVSTVNKRITPPGSQQRIAFSAHLSHDLSGLGTSQTIPFDIITLNEGQAFDSILHTFICPLSGIYVFQSAILSANHDWMQTEIVKDGHGLVNVVAHGSNVEHGHDQGFNSVITACNKGERVWVRKRAFFGGTNLTGNRYTSFSGYLLWSTQ
ncbi:uncharacterized protein LOC128559905 [Mercenaria mercenaria]|uniref:uncharacterized protein LOC128559905 n=1 Tax=Mercenaria mercenaria TaxID=6596 RepID=UPI00234F3733|nr:uncharacterized protein LOC128559905 [Mercenaria mercenaria]